MELLLFVLVHMYIKLCESAVIEAFGIGELQRFVFKQAVTGLRQILQIIQNKYICRQVESFHSI